MNLDELSTALNNADATTFKIGFVFHSDSRYIMYGPNLVDELHDKILSMYIEVFSNWKSRKDKLDDLEMISFDPTIVSQNSSIEIIDNLDFGNIDKIVNEQILSHIRPVRELNKEWNKISFTVSQVRSGDEDIILFSTFSVGKSLVPAIRGIMASDNTFKESKVEPVGIESRIDLILFRNQMLVINHSAVDKIFFLKDYLENQVESFFDVINNIQSKNGHETIQTADLKFLKELCRYDQSKMKKLWHVNAIPGRIQKFFDNADNLPNVITRFNLHLKYDVEKNCLECEHTVTSLNELLSCMSDRYYLSILFGEPGYDESKR